MTPEKQKELEAKAEELQELEDCANGKPYFLIVQNGDKITSRVKPGFDIGLIFQALIRIMERWPNFKNEYADNIVELTKALKQ